MLCFNLLLLSLACLSVSAPLPLQHNLVRAITLSHTSTSTGESASTVLEPSLLGSFGAAFARVFNTSSHLNIHIATPKRSVTPPRPRRHRFRTRGPAAGISNSTINLTVISRRAKAAVAAAAAATGEHHNVYIDASGSGGTGGGIHESTINVNVITNSKRAPLPSPEPVTTVGEHSVLLDLSNDAEGNGGIEDSTVHVNILPVRGDKAIGDHSILIDSSSSNSPSSSDETTAGDYSAVVAASITASTINLTVVAPKLSSSELSAVEDAKRGVDVAELVERTASEEAAALLSRSKGFEVREVRKARGRDHERRRIAKLDVRFA